MCYRAAPRRALTHARATAPRLGVTASSRALPVSNPPPPPPLQVLTFHILTFTLYALLPASSTPGYVLRADGHPSPTRLPGFATLLVVLLAAAAAVRAGVPATLLWDHFAAVCAASCAFGVALAAAFYARGLRLAAAGALDERARCPTVDQAAALGAPPLPRATAAEAAEFRARAPATAFYAGLSEFNPRLLGVDVKMWLYATGAIQLALTAGSAVAADARARGGAAGLGASTAAALLAFFIAEYMWQEAVHCWTYDILRERLGLKLLWGCTFFYPCFYALPVGAAAAAARDAPPAAAAAAAARFAAGWVLTRGANLQKHACKTGARGPLFGGLVSMATVRGSGGRVLCAGFWGVSRHVNYLGEILQALALALPAVAASHSPLALLYPLYYVALFVPRQIDDDRICAEKYGPEVWAEYVRAVPWRIVPGVW